MIERTLQRSSTPYIEKTLQQSQPESEKKITENLSPEEKMAESFKDSLLGWYRCDNFKDLSESAIEDIINNLKEALANKIINVADLTGINCYTVRDIFSNELGSLVLKEKLFTLKEIDPIDTYTTEGLLTSKGMSFLREIKEDSRFSGIDKLHPRAIWLGIEKCDIEEVFKTEKSIREEEQAQQRYFNEMKEYSGMYFAGPR